MDKFVCVRVVKANHLDLNLLQFDYDLTFAVIFLGPDKQVYGRFGTRSDRHDAEKDISLEGLGAALRRALLLHQHRESPRYPLDGKQPRPSKYATAAELPGLKGKYGTELDYQGEVVRSCMHCHQIRDAQRQVYRDAGQPIPDQLLFPYPTPETIGMELDPRHAAKVARIEPDSPAAQAGLQVGDEIQWLDGQPILSIADVQWVLHHADSTDSIKAVVSRNRKQISLQIDMPAGWRKKTDIAWRVSTWPLRRMGTGGLVLETLTAEQRAEAELSADQMALRVEHVGQYGPHAAAKRAGFQKNDVVISFDGRGDLTTESALLAYAAQATKPGQKVPVSVLRSGKRIELQLPMQP